MRTAATPRAPGPIRAVVFDVYGTLFQSGSGDVGLTLPNKPTAVVRALREVGLEVSDRAGVVVAAEIDRAIRAAHTRERRRGIDFPEVEIREIWRLVLQSQQIAVPTSRVEALCTVYECLVNPTWPMPGAREALSRIGSRYRTGIVSNAQFYTPLLFSALMGGSPAELGFDICVWSFELRRAKPSTVPFAKVVRSLAHRFGISPGHTLYVGNDMLNDVWAAGRAGLRTVLFCGDRRSLRHRPEDPRVRGAAADLQVRDLTELADVLEA